MQTVIRQRHVWSLGVDSLVEEGDQDQSRPATEDALVKALHLGICGLIKKLTDGIQGWGQIIQRSGTPTAKVCASILADIGLALRHLSRKT